MPKAPASPCLDPLCPEYAVREGRCEPHAKEREQLRGNSAARGYDILWRRFREWFLRRHPVCNDCGHEATEVHHKIKVRVRPDLRLVESNCMALCKACHSIRTMRGE